MCYVANYLKQDPILKLGNSSCLLQVGCFPKTAHQPRMKKSLSFVVVMHARAASECLAQRLDINTVHRDIGIVGYDQQ